MPTTYWLNYNYLDGVVSDGIRKVLQKKLEVLAAELEVLEWKEMVIY